MHNAQFTIGRKLAQIALISAFLVDFPLFSTPPVGCADTPLKEGGEEAVRPERICFLPHPH